MSSEPVDRPKIGDLLDPLSFSSSQSALTCHVNLFAMTRGGPLFKRWGRRIEKRIFL